MKTRIISAVVALAIVVPLIIIGGIPLSIGVGIISLLALKEIISLNKENKMPKLIIVLGTVSLLGLIYTFYYPQQLLLILTIIILSLTIPILFYQNKTYTIKESLSLIGWIILLGFAFRFLILIRSEDINLLVLLLLIIIFTDTFALIFGMLIGRNKLAPEISPKKTWEGAIGGTIIGTTVGSLYYILLINPELPLFYIILGVLLISVVGQIGDLVFSQIKRLYNIKDFSNIMPGHGGILDRIDSLVFGILIMTVLLSLV